MTYLLFVTALGLSACAAYYSIMGLVAIFASAVVPILIMGSLLEASKLVVASWLYRNFKEIPVLLRAYFTVALVILMLLTSMGIFGYLSKAHLDQAVPSGDVAAKLSLLNEKIKTEKDNINTGRKELSQLDAQVDQTLSRTTEASGSDRAISIRRGQQKDRQRILKEIGESQTKIAKFNEDRAPIASEVRKVEAEVGPIKYIAALIYDNAADDAVLEKSVRWVIILIVSVFDPLAVLLLIAANWQQKRDTEGKDVHIADDVALDPPEPEVVHQMVEPTVNPIVWTSSITTSEYIEPVLPLIEEDKLHPSDKPIIEDTPTEIVADKVGIDEELNITVDDSKDWEPNLYNRLEKRDETLPEKTQSFLAKTKEVFSLQTPNSN